MRLTVRQLTSLGVTAARAERSLPDLNRLLPEHGIDPPLRVAHFLAQVLHESGRFAIVEENLRYSAKRLREVFPKYFTAAQTERYAGRPEAIANRVYGGRMGNGPEASGDGYRYRGRGLIQLTGRDNYRQFATWVGDDVVANPDLVATRYAVHSAVFYWTRRDLNAAADADDVRAVTRLVNGGLNGLAERIELLARVRRVLAVEVPEPDAPTHVVIATQLNLRSKPIVTPSTRIATLPEGTPVTVLDAVADGWVRIRTLIGGQLAEGVVSARYLERIAATRALRTASPQPALPPIPPVHLKEHRPDVTRRRDGGHAYPLGEPGMPRRDANDVADRAAQLHAIIAWLDSERRTHLRYAPKGATTYCNVYAYDYCHLAGVYLPRVFWTPAALVRLGAGEAVPVRYGDTVRELNANALHDWLHDFGPSFGWHWVSNLDELQALANLGQVCLIVAKRKDLNRSGHIAAVAPEGPLRAARHADGTVRNPVESQAGATNHRLIVKPSPWWRTSQFQSFGFWRHE